MCLHSRSGFPSCKFYHLHLPPLTRSPNVGKIFLFQAPWIGYYPSRPIVYSIKTCHCTFFSQGESQTSNNQTTIQTDAPSNHQGAISGDIWWRTEDITWPRRNTKFVFECWKIFHLFTPLTRERFFQHEKRNFVSPSDHVMFYLLYKHQWNTKPF